MPQSDRSKPKAIPSSLTNLGASEGPATVHSDARPGAVASVAAAGVSLLACQCRGDFPKEYLDLSFTDSNSQTHYGWIYGSETGEYSDLTYDLISYGYDATPTNKSERDIRAFQARTWLRIESR